MKKIDFYNLLLLLEQLEDQYGVDVSHVLDEVNVLIDDIEETETDATESKEIQ